MISAVYPFLLTAHAVHSFRNCLLLSAVCCLMISAVYPSRSCLVFFAVYHFVLSAHAVHPCCPPKLSTLFCFLLFTLLDTVYSFLLSAHAAFSFLRLCCLPFQELSTLSAVHPRCPPMLSTVFYSLPMLRISPIGLAALHQHHQSKFL